MLSPPHVRIVPVVLLALICVVFVLGEITITVRSRQRAGLDGSDRADQRAKITAIAAIVVLLGGAGVASAALPAVTIAPHAPTMLWTVFGLGTLVAAAGIGLRQWAIHHLGRFFTLDVRAVSDQTVVDDGPYRLVSHPSYTGALATYLGLGLMLDNWLSLALTLLPLPLYIKRIRVEEQHLTGELGQPYQHYLGNRHRLIPGIW